MNNLVRTLAVGTIAASGGCANMSDLDEFCDAKPSMIITSDKHALDFCEADCENDKGNIYGIECSTNGEIKKMSCGSIQEDNAQQIQTILENQGKCEGIAMDPCLRQISYFTFQETVISSNTVFQRCTDLQKECKNKYNDIIERAGLTCKDEFLSCKEILNFQKNLLDDELSGDPCEMKNTGSF